VYADGFFPTTKQNDGIGTFHFIGGEAKQHNPTNLLYKLFLDDLSRHRYNGLHLCLIDGRYIGIA
jgi:hypothetical protein